jgi:hypothetical protein
MVVYRDVTETTRPPGAQLAGGRVISRSLVVVARRVTSSRAVAGPVHQQQDRHHGLYAI